MKYSCAKHRCIILVFVGFLLVEGMPLVHSVGFCQEEAASTASKETLPLGSLRKIISGEVESVNYATGVVMIKQLIDGQSSIYRKEMITVDEHTQISKGFGITSFSGIIVGDKATVEYWHDETTGRDIAISVLVVASEVVKSKDAK